MSNVETYYLIDFENVNNADLICSRHLDYHDHIHIFSTKNAPKISIEILSNFHSVDYSFHCLPAGKQSLDMHLTAYLGYLLGTNGDKNGWILGYTVSPRNLHDSRTFKGLYDKIKNIGIKTLVADAGYKTPAIAKLLIDDGVTPLFPYKRPMTKEGFFKKYEYAYDEYYDCYICPNNQVLKYSTTNRDGYREYKSCGNVWENYMEQCEDVRHTLGMKKLYEQRKETIERIFGTAKENHGFRYTQMYGKARMEMKVGLTFACMNLKKLAMMLQKSGRKGCLISTFLSFWANDCCKQRKMVLGQQS